MPIRCAIYTRKSTDDGLEQEFNSLHAQREACEAYIKSQRGMGWTALAVAYDDGGLSGGTLDRPALQQLLAGIQAHKVDTVVAYKVDRLTRSLADFAKIVEVFDAHEVSFVSVTQQFNTTTSMGRLTLNMLLSFAQFEREVTGERIRDKIAASKRKGMWMGGPIPLGYDSRDKKLVVNGSEAEVVRRVFSLYLELGGVDLLKQETDHLGLVTKRHEDGSGFRGGLAFSRGNLYQMLHNPIYAGEIAHKGKVYPGQHERIIAPGLWEAVQKRLNTNTRERRAPANITGTFILTGKLFDETGDRLSPTSANRNGKRHRYYVSRRLLRTGDRSNGGWRLSQSAQTFEPGAALPRNGAAQPGQDDDGACHRGGRRWVLLHPDPAAQLPRAGGREDHPPGPPSARADREEACRRHAPANRMGRTARPVRDRLSQGIGCCPTAAPR